MTMIDWILILTAEQQKSDTLLSWGQFINKTGGAFTACRWSPTLAIRCTTVKQQHHKDNDLFLP